MEVKIDNKMQVCVDGEKIGDCKLTNDFEYLLYDLDGVLFCKCPSLTALKTRVENLINHGVF